MKLDPHLAALDAFATREDLALAGATRLRIRASLEHGHAWRRHASLLAALAVLLVASASWALATGRLRRWLTPPRVLHAALPAPDLEPAGAAPAVAAVPVALAVHESVPVARTVHASAPAPAEPAATTRQLATGEHATREPAPPPSASEVLYARAHELHFHGNDPSAALAAWDAYLAAEPTGTFAVEARYNRALCLVRLGHLADARSALAPFARGEVEPRGYRQPDAARLIERIDRRVPAAANALNGSP